MVKIILISMIKNEEKIIERCITSVLPIVDAICVTDTGSTDTTVNIVNNLINEFKITGKIFIDEWQNFGYNRNNSYLNAVAYCKELGWNLNETYGLLLDADMKLVINKFDKDSLSSNGYKIIQDNSFLEYYNTRFVNMGVNWKCVGVTHEYWDGSDTDTLTKESIYIDDIGDGGSKGDKTERDIRLLEKGIIDEPNNVRYYFYLAQSYKDCGNFKKAITLYKKRINMGGWYEEIWYSYYMIAKCQELLNEPENFEKWALKAYKYRNCRAEAIYILTKYFREKSQYFKAYYYYLIGKNIKTPDEDLLFIEKDIYDGMFDYENTILHYYIFPNERLEGLKFSINYINNYNRNESLVFDNSKFYMQRLLDEGESIKIDVNNYNDFIPSSTSLLKLDNKILANIRFVNYRIQKDGTYLMSKNGILSDNENVRTKNAYMYYNLKMEPISNLIFMNDNVVDLPKRDTTILGLEDIRLYKLNNKIYYTATSLEYSYTDAIRIVKGEYNLDNNNFINNLSLKPQEETYCEKNWIAIEDKFIYNWCPLQIGILNNDKLEIINEIETPLFFQYYRGSSNTYEYNNEFWLVTHGIQNCEPRKYFHQIVVLNKKYELVKYTVPFYFDKLEIEYCLGLLIINEVVYMTVSRNDSNPIICKIKLKNLEKYFM